MQALSQLRPGENSRDPLFFSHSSLCGSVLEFALYSLGFNEGAVMVAFPNLGAHEYCSTKSWLYRFACSAPHSFFSSIESEDPTH